MQDPAQGGPIVVKPVPHQIEGNKQITWLDGEGNAVTRDEAIAAAEAPEEPALTSEEQYYWVPDSDDTLLLSCLGGQRLGGQYVRR